MTQWVPTCVKDGESPLAWPTLGSLRWRETHHKEARMDLGLKGRAALVTGASRGIGRGVAMELAREGCRIALCARGKDMLDGAAAEVRGLGVETIAVPADVTTAA